MNDEEKAAARRELDDKLSAWSARMAERPAVAPEPCQHEWGTAYKSSSGRKVCVKCGLVTSAPFEALGIAERAK